MQRGEDVMLLVPLNVPVVALAPLIVVADKTVAVQQTGIKAILVVVIPMSVRLTKM